MKAIILAQIEGVLIESVTRLAIEAIHTGTILACQKLQELRDEHAAPAQNTETVYSDEPVHFNDIVTQTNTPANKVSALLLELELAGKVKRMPGDMFVAVN